MDDLIPIELTAHDWLVVLACVEMAARNSKVAPWEIGPEDEVRKIAQNMARVCAVIAGQARTHGVKIGEA